VLDVLYSKAPVIEAPWIARSDHSLRSRIGYSH
jgi:hypothetical protein